MFPDAMKAVLTDEGPAALVTEGPAGLWRELTERLANLWDTVVQGVIGFIWAVADTWLASGMQRPRQAVVDDVAALFTPAFTPLTRS